MKTFFSAYTCKGNVGDILINKLQIEEYARYGEVYVDCTGMPAEFYDIIFDTANPNIKDFVKTYGINYRGKNILRVLRPLKKEGFTHFTKSPGPYAYLKLPLKTFVKRLAGAFGYWMARREGMKVIALGIDLDFSGKNKWLRSLNWKYFSVYHLLGLRSRWNDKLLSDRLSNTQYVPDMAFLYPMPTDMPSLSDRKRVALSFRKGDDADVLVGKLKMVCGKLRDLHFDIDIVYQVKEDEDFSATLAQALKEYDVHLCQQMIEYGQLNTYSQYAYVISNRLHVCLMGAMHGAIPVAIISHNRKEQKVGRIFDSAFSVKLWWHQEEPTESLLERIVNDRRTIARTLTQNIQKQKHLCEKAFQEIR